MVWKSRNIQLQFRITQFKNKWQIIVLFIRNCMRYTYQLEIDTHDQSSIKSLSHFTITISNSNGSVANSIDSVRSRLTVRFLTNYLWVTKHSMDCVTYFILNTFRLHNLFELCIISPAFSRTVCLASSITDQWWAPLFPFSTTRFFVKTLCHVPVGPNFSFRNFWQSCFY